MKKIRIKFTDFWPTLHQTSHYCDNFFLHLLQKRFSVQLSYEPEVLFYSVFGSEHKKYHCYKVFYTGENVRPNFEECHFAFSFDHLQHENHYRLPIYVLYLESPELLVKQDFDVDRIIKEKTKFCNFIYSNPLGTKRIEFFERLSKYKPVDSAGKVLNNIAKPLGGFTREKLAFIKDYKFTIAFENSEYPGYTTEKLIHPMLVHSLPIYWGNPLVHLDFNPKSFINYYDFPDEETLIEHIIELDQNDELYREYLLEPYYHNNQVNPLIEADHILDVFEKIFKEALS